jgi:hypothetical protein
MKNKLLNKDFFYSGLSCEYDNRYNCKSSDCYKDICRCGVIINERVTDVSVSKVVNKIYKTYFDESESTIRDFKIKSILFGTDKELEIYTIDRIVRKFKIWDKNNWNILVCKSYYGEEVDSICLFENISYKLEEQLYMAFAIGELNKRVEFLLYLEYGRVLIDLANCEYEIVDVDKSNIFFGSEAHHKSVKKKELSHYSDDNYNGIRGIVLEKDGKLRLIDGYHRIHSTKGHKVRVLKARKIT